MDKDLPVLMKLRTQCIRGFDENWKLCRWNSKSYELLHSMHRRKGWLCWEIIHFAFVTYCYI
jgi:hypothetical protein